MPDDGLNVLTIYDRPEDHPRHVVLTSWWIGSDGMRLLGSALCDTVDEARAIPIARGMYCLPRAEEDHPSVVESWM